MNDFRLAFRSLTRSRGFTVVAVLTLALGIGASAALFSVVHAVVLRPLAFPSADRLVAVRIVMPAFAHVYPTLPVNARFFQEWRDCPAFSGLALLDRGRSTLTGAGEPIRVSALECSANLFSTLHVEPTLGRAFAADEDTPGRPPVVVLGNLCWRTRFSADPAILGRTIMLDQRPFTVIGVLPADFRLPETPQFPTGKTSSGAPEVFVPKIFAADELAEITGRNNYDVIGRLTPGVSATEALAQMNLVAARLARLANEDLEIRGFLTPLHEAVVGPARRGLFILLGAIVAVLLIACLNLSMLALARAERRSHDYAVRSALGASRACLLREAMVESLLLSLAGGGLGWLFASWGLSALLGLAPDDLPRLDEVRLDSTVLLFALAATIATAVITGLIPAWRAARNDASVALHGTATRTTTGGIGARQLRHLLIAIEVGMSTLLLAAATLLGSSFLRLVHVDSGVHEAGTLSTNLAIPSAKYSSDADRNDYHRRLLAEVAATPGIASAAITTALPLQGETWIDSVSTPGDTRPTVERPTTNVRFISSDFFATLGIPILAGRTFRDSDDNNAVVVSAQLAARLWPGQDPVGRQVARGDNAVYQVIGLVGDVRANADQRPVPVLYRPYWAWSPINFILVAKVEGSAAAIAPAVKQSIHHVDAEVPVAAFRTMDDILGAALAQRRFNLRLTGVFALSALTLAGLGLYGVVSHSVVQRTREFGIRLALGARPSRLRRMVLGQGIKPLLVGLLGGLTVALAGGQLLASLLYETDARDPVALALVVVVEIAVAVVACWLPARRTTRVDPIQALRAE